MSEIITNNNSTNVRLWSKTLTQAKQHAASHMARYAFAAKYVAGKSVCDVACGAGYGSNYLAQTAKSVTAIDISTDAIDWARKYFNKDNMKFFAADAAKPWPLEDKFDVITSFESMEHVESPQAFLENVYNHLSLDGLFILSVPNGPRDKKKTDNPHHLHHFNDVDLKTLIEKFFPKAEYFSQAYKKGIKHYTTKLLRKARLLNKQPYFVKNYFLKPGLHCDLKTWFVVTQK